MRGVSAQQCAPCLWSRSGATSGRCASTAPDGGNGSAAERWRGGGGW
ncbi:hypothetical protein RQM80_24885 [Citrobacter freundii]|nr:hypothetical protein [Citrobacter freundii]